MPNELIRELALNDLLSTEAGQKILQVLETISAVQKGLLQLAENDDSAQLDLLKIGTVFQIFLIDTLASGKKPKDLKKEDWKNIADKVAQYAVYEKGQRYTEFIFTLYADYIDLSVKVMEPSVPTEHLDAIRELSAEIRSRSALLKADEPDEVAYVEQSLWLSLEAMMKLLCTYFAMRLPAEYAHLLQSAAQFAFEYGRFVLYKKEQEILAEFLEKQRTLDDELEKKFEAYLAEVQEQADAFQQLIDGAFSAEISDALRSSADLARAAGVKEKELLLSVEDVDAFFLD